MTATASTTTGGFAIGFRRGWSPWQRDLEPLVRWARDNAFAAVDLGNDADVTGPEVIASGGRIGSVDLPEWKGMISADPATREAAVEKNTAYIERCAGFGALIHFAVMLPEDPGKAPGENFRFMVESFRELAPVMERVNAKLVIEGYPAPGALCCNPEGFRAFFDECPSPAMGVNYDPSHLIRMGIDPIRFLREFSGRVYHVHGKDTEIMPEAVYEFGWSLPPILAKGHGFGSTFWRYTIPGHGVTRWSEALRILKAAGYSGLVCVELEDENFNGTEEGEKRGLLLSRDFLRGV
jgi:sugar phosphate isomerase/epimerase